MALNPMSLDARKIEFVVDAMRDARRKDQRAGPGSKAHLAIARNALDEILRTKKYKFGVALFKELERHFTEVREDLASMRRLIEDRS